MGADTWTRTEKWPPSGVREVTLYMTVGSALSPKPSDKVGVADEYGVDFEAGTGRSNRWATSMGGVPVIYEDRAEADKRLLVFTGEPLAKPMTITGHPQVTLHVASTHEDGAFLVYLEAVAPDGRVVYLTEGVLRAIHRRVSDDAPPYEMFGPYRTFLRKDAWPLTPGERAELTFNLLPTSVRIEAGWRLRVALAGHDKDTFLRVPETGRPVVRVFLGADAPSCIRLPVDFAAAPDSRGDPA